MARFVLINKILDMGFKANQESNDGSMTRRRTLSLPITRRTIKIGAISMAVGPHTNESDSIHGDTIIR
jgi:hypothetical protein